MQQDLMSNFYPPHGCIDKFGNYFIHQIFFTNGSEHTGFMQPQHPILRPYP
jgi:hypothetical protein